MTLAFRTIEVDSAFDGVNMQMRIFVRFSLSCALAATLLTLNRSWAATLEQTETMTASTATVIPGKMNVDVDAQLPQSGPKLDEMIDRISKSENELMKELEDFHPLIETYIQRVKPDSSFGTVLKSDYYFLGQADFRGHLKVRSMIETRSSIFSIWSFNPTGFLQMAFVDRGGFDRVHYTFKPVRREFLGDVRCIRFEVEAAPRVRGVRFAGSIWVEDQGYSIVRINGRYSPAVHFSLKTLEDEFYLHFDCWRTNVKPGLWLPTYIYSQEINRPYRLDNPSFRAATHIWGYKLKQGSRAEELNRLLIESPNPVKDEAPQHDRSPLEAQREWRREAERNILDSLERVALLAPPSDVDNILNTIVNNLEVTNNLEGEIDLRCRVLLTGNLEMFSVGNTIVLSRGLIDVVPDEATLAAILAHEIADAMLPKPYRDRYAFSDILRLSPTEILRRLSFEEGKKESIENSDKAMELLKKSPYAQNLSAAGLFLVQLQAESKKLKQLITPQLGNGVFLAPQLMQVASSLQPNNKDQIAALPLGSRIKVDPWTAGVSLMKTKPVPRFSARDKLPFEITPLPPYLARYAEPSATPQTSDPVKEPK
jgi:hypothetical protein